jgi:S-DNA-T family DNA segregation ATPase FtsK/SpoIIIE
MNEAQNFDLPKKGVGQRETTFEFKNYQDELETHFYEQEELANHKTKHQTPQEFLAEQKAEFENLDPDEVRKKFAKEFSDIRPYGNLELNEQVEQTLVEKFVPFKEVSLDDTEFLNDLAQETNLSEQFVEETKTSSLEANNSVDENYLLPPLSLLDDFKQDQSFVDENKIYALEKQQAIDQAFNEFKVGAKVVDISYGPSVIKFQILPDPGTKVNSISALENDLKLALASQDIRIEAPIPGKNLVGIEIENKHRLIVGLKELMIKMTTKKFKSKLVFVLGKDGENQPIFEDLAKMPHLLVSGSTGSGKSVMINALIISLLMQTKPNEVKLLLIDPKKVELGIYSSLPHMLMPVISDMKQANQALKVVISEMERRYELFAQHNVRNLESYNNKSEVSRPLPYYVIIIDELADLMMTSNRREVEDSIMRITQMARAAGIHLIVATQRPSVDVVTGVIKANIPTRISFSVASIIDSRTILDSGGAEKLTLIKHQIIMKIVLLPN